MAMQRRVLFSKLNTTLFQTLGAASAFCRLRKHAYIELAHWLDQLIQLQDCDLHHIFRHYNIDSALLSQQVSTALNQLPAGANAISDFSHHIDIAIERAWMQTTLHTDETHIRSAYLLAALLETPDLQHCLLRIAPVLADLPKEHAIETFSPVIQQSIEADTSTSTSAPQNLSEPSAHSPLKQYCTDLTELALQEKLDPVIGREQEIQTMIDILLRRRQNNPLITGEAGVGKTAVVEGLAHAIVNGNVPPALQGHQLLSVDMGALLAGASMKGEFEERLKSLLDAAMKATPAVILFIDEVHTLVGAGGQEGTGDAANLLKPLLARGALKTIGATTWREYKRYIEKDPALTRRFQVLQVLAPEEAKAVHIVRGLADVFAKHHQVYLTDEAICAAVSLSHRYIPDRQLPDKAISLLDTACARVALSLHAEPLELIQLRETVTLLSVEQNRLNAELPLSQKHRQRLSQIHHEITNTIAQLEDEMKKWQQERLLVENIHHLRQQETSTPEEADFMADQFMMLYEDLQTLQQDRPFVYPQVDAHVVADIVSQWTGIPAGQVSHDRLATIQQLPQQLTKRVIGQDHALNRISQCIQTSHAQLTDPNKPMGVFLLAGPSGVGKTETALALADALYGGEQNLITINMSEFQENHTISTLKGSPPGYVGYGEGGVLTEAVRRRPYSILLLDEIEKAHTDIYELFYQVFDKGWMKDSEGRYIDFKNTLILLTSNACADLISQLCDDEIAPSTDQLEKLLQQKLTDYFPKAFLGRLNVVPYLPLDNDKLADILRLHLNKVVRRIAKNHDIELSYSDAVIAHILQHCEKQETGARHFIQYIERHILPSLSQQWMTAQQEKQAIKTITIDVEATSLIYQTTFH